MARKTRASLVMWITVMLSCMLVDSRSSPRTSEASAAVSIPAAPQDSSVVGGSASTSSAGEAQVPYESGFIVETFLDGNRLNMSIHSTLAVPSQDFLYAIDSAASQLLRISLPIDQGKGAEVARRVAGDGRGQTGYIDGWGEDALLDHPKGMAVDGDGNVYIADVRNGVIRKLTPAGYVTTIAGQRNRTGYGDGEGKDALFSADFGLAFVPRNCSLLIADRGNRRLRMIQLKPRVNCNSGRSVSSGHSWKIVSAFSMGVSVILSVALIKVELQRREFQRAATAFLSLNGNQNGEASDDPDSGYREATRPLLTNSAATHRSAPPDLIDLLEAPFPEREHGQPTDRLANSAAYGSRDGENDFVLSISSAGEEGDEGTSTPQEHNSESMLTGPNDSLSGHLHTNSSRLPSARRITLDEGIDRSLYQFSQSGGN